MRCLGGESLQLLEFFIGSHPGMHEHPLRRRMLAGRVKIFASQSQSYLNETYDPGLRGYAKALRGDDLPPHKGLEFVVIEAGHALAPLFPEIATHTPHISGANFVLKDLNLIWADFDHG